MKTNFKMIPLSLWDSIEFRAFMHLEKLLYLYLVASPMTRPIGIFRIDLDWVAFQFKISRKKVLEFIQKLEAMGLVVYKCEYSEIYLRHYLVQYQTLGGPPLMKLLKRDMVPIRDRSLLRMCLEENRDFMAHRPDYHNATVQQFLDEALQDLQAEELSEEVQGNDQSPEVREPMIGDPAFDYSRLAPEENNEVDFSQLPF